MTVIFSSGLRTRLTSSRYGPVAGLALFKVLRNHRSVPILFMVANIQKLFHVESLEKISQGDFHTLSSAMYLQVSTINQGP
ncbi:H(+)-ATPase 5 [Zea mays]|uniref:H(+)-ATPase 5 n=1 Tax=Zea mays TaxID=4577 RepID=B4FEY7_MAIZE|nr:unknown [Zea mays]AQK66005.1 H(+)-ATPase 5 [Zea mays]AQK66010.1 H(+)-ATPase 5 [Zea mays]